MTRNNYISAIMGLWSIYEDIIGLNIVDAVILKGVHLKRLKGKCEKMLEDHDNKITWQKITFSLDGKEWNYGSS